ncbi:hypothetical protein VE04_02099 [Pseudogymnoascus sp. 24MN13]|nr:hypothetical protein VE04_02099 [Pseudogymnoascus sp. 24MN13]
MASEHFQKETSWDEWQMYGHIASQQMYRPYGYPPRPQRSWGDEALQQLRPKLLQLDMAIPEHPSHDSSLTDDKRKEVCQYHEDNPSATQAKIAAEFGFRRSIISKILKHKEQHLRQSQTQSTAVDALMRAIQAKPAGDSSSEAAAGEKRARAPYECNSGQCRKAFFRKAHLEIHIGAHTGAKPYTCTHPSCTHAFSQLGNLKTHLRRHAGDRPFACPTCGKTFVHRCEVRAHAAVHDAGGAAKKFVCRLDGCGKCFTQLGNLKSHMNKFHVETLRGLMGKGEGEEGAWEGEESRIYNLQHRKHVHIPAFAELLNILALLARFPPTLPALIDVDILH